MYERVVGNCFEQVGYCTAVEEALWSLFAERDSLKYHHDSELNVPEEDLIDGKPLVEVVGQIVHKNFDPGVRVGDIDVREGLWRLVGVRGLLILDENRRFARRDLYNEETGRLR